MRPARETRAPPGKRRITLSRIGVYGGTFDPIHNGHVKVAKDLLTLFALDRLLLIPASTPPHKDPRSISNAHHRYTMTVLALENEPQMVASLFEIERPDLPYSVQTVSRMREQYAIAATDLFFLIGADSFAELHTWRDPMTLVENCNLVVTTRPGYSLNLETVPDSWQRRIVDVRGHKVVDNQTLSETRIFLTDLTWVDVSATQIRDAAHAGQPISDWVPPRVADYIEKYGLYRTVND